MHILVAEDDHNLRHGLEVLLKEEGFDCTTTENGHEAFLAFEKHKPDFCILDVMMPELDGFELCRLIRQHDENIPIILLTAKGEEVDRVVGLELGADDYIAKPFGTRELIARIKAITRRVAKPGNKTINKSAPFIMGHLSIDPTTLRAQTGNKIIELTLRELNVLEMLFQNKGMVIKRHDLFEKCWGRPYMANSRALDQFVSQLRQKIEVDATNPSIIKTVHGVGYRFEETIKKSDGLT